MDTLRDQNLIDLAYLIAAAAFIIGIRKLGSPRTARSGNLIAGAGMTLALVATLIAPAISNYAIMFGVMVVGGALGWWSARAVKMTAMPQMVALFNGVGGGAIACIALAEFYLADGQVDELEFLLGTVLSAAIGAISFAGSIIAFAKLQELMTGRPITWPGQNLMNGAIFLAVLGLGGWALTGDATYGAFGLMVGLALLLGAMFVLPIGGADMPVVISLLNSFTGVAAAMAGFMLNNTVLIIAGTLVGASGFLLTRMMGEAMNRPVSNVLFGAFGSGGGETASGGSSAGGEMKPATVEDVAIMLGYARQVVIVPGYGLAVAQAQHTVRELSESLESRGVTVKFAIHPVAGRMPGHMNVLLAEANVPYDQLFEMEQINGEFKNTDVSLVIGANDVVNPAAKNEPDSPLYGMPVLNVDDSTTVVVLKRGRGTGFSGVENPLFGLDNTRMLYGDAKDSVAKLVTAVAEV